MNEWNQLPQAGAVGAATATSPTVAKALERALAGEDPTISEITALLNAQGADLWALLAAADALRQRQVGNIATYVVNRNINFTNVCIKRCGFCAFSRDFRGEEGYFLPIEEVVRRAQEAVAYGATEICVQAGLAPKLPGDYYLRLTRRIKEVLPDLHIHGFSPEEVYYGSVRARVGIRDYLLALKEAGVGSLPGTSAEILVQSVRDRIAPGRIRADRWEEVIRTAHELGIPTTATIMYGHVETAEEQARHLDRIRRIQKDTGGFTEFVPLSFVHQEAPMWRHGDRQGMRPGPSALEVVRMHAVSRVVLGAYVPHIQASWVKEGLRMAQWLLQAGADDLGGTLMNESISTAAGAEYGQLLPPRTLREAIRAAGRIPAERTTLYRYRRIFDGPEAAADPLDRLAGENQPTPFGSYALLVRSPQFRYRSPAARAQAE